MELCGSGGCIDGLATVIATQALAAGTQLPCNLTADQVEQCIAPLVQPLSQAGANLMALMQCDAAAAAKRLAARFQCQL